MRIQDQPVQSLEFLKGDEMINKYNNSSLARQGYYTSYKDFDSKSKPKRLETSRAGILSLLIGIIIILVPVTYYLSLKSQVTSNKIVISELNHKLDKLKIENDANEIEMKSKLDLNNIYDTAIKN